MTPSCVCNNTAPTGTDRTGSTDSTGRQRRQAGRQAGTNARTHATRLLVGERRVARRGDGHPRLQLAHEAAQRHAVLEAVRHPALRVDIQLGHVPDPLEHLTYDMTAESWFILLWFTPNKNTRGVCVTTVQMFWKMAPRGKAGGRPCELWTLNIKKKILTIIV